MNRQDKLLLTLVAVASLPLAPAFLFGWMLIKILDFGSPVRV